MKSILYYFLVLFMFLEVFTSCTEMDSTYSEFIVPGGINYPGKAVNAVVYAGRNRVKIVWLRGTDPSVVKTRIFWDNYTDSVEVATPAQGDTLSVIINNLEEKTYVFTIKTYDSKGNISVPIELLSSAYGERYQANLLSQSPFAAILDNQGNVTIEWGTANITGGAYQTEVVYTDVSNKTLTQRFSATESTLALTGLKPGTTFQYRTSYLPSSFSIDTFYTSYTENKEFVFKKSEWSIIAFSSQHTADATNGIGNIIDGSAATRWHTLSTSKYPHYVTIDMKAKKKISGFELFRTTGDVRACDKFQLFVSLDNVIWTDLGVFNFDRLTDNGQYYGMVSNPEARYFKFVGLAGPNPFMVSGEINVYGK